MERDQCDRCGWGHRHHGCGIAHSRSEWHQHGGCHRQSNLGNAACVGCQSNLDRELGPDSNRIRCGQWGGDGSNQSRFRHLGAQKRIQHFYRRHPHQRGPIDPRCAGERRAGKRPRHAQWRSAFSGTNHRRECLDRQWWRPLSGEWVWRQLEWPGDAEFQSRHSGARLRENDLQRQHQRSWRHHIEWPGASRAGGG